jgi:hypothetical protein
VIKEVVMALTGKGRAYLERRQIEFQNNSLLNTAYGSSVNNDFTPRGYPFEEYVSAERKDRETLQILKKW